MKTHKIIDVPNLNIKQEIQYASRQYGFRLKKKLGQNFVQDKSVIETVVGALGLQPDDYILEIGAGMGTLTAALIEVSEHVTSVEIDHYLYSYLRDKFLGEKQLCLVQGDILTLSQNTLFPENREIKVTGNLPYYISSAVLKRLVGFSSHIPIMALMFQKEVAHRIVSAPGSKDYGILSIATQLYYRGEIVETFPAQAFFPSPQVSSSLVVFNRLDKPLVGIDEEKYLMSLVKVCFRQRRKKIKNTLSSWMNSQNISYASVEDILKENQINPVLRPEQIAIEDFIRLARSLRKGSR